MSETNKAHEAKEILEVEVVKGTEKDTGTHTNLGFLEGITKSLNDFFCNTCPKLPKDILDFFVNNASVLNIIGMVFSAIGILLGLKTVVELLNLQSNPFLASILKISGQSPTMLIISGFVSLLLAGVALFFAYKAQPGLKPKKISGWNNMYYGFLVAILSVIINSILTFIPGMIITLPITLAIYGLILYVLFQMRSSFNAK